MQEEATLRDASLRHALRMEEAVGTIMSALRSRSVLERTFLRKSLGILMIARSEDNRVFRLLLAAVKNPDTEEADRALFRWARGNQHQRGGVYTLLARKASAISPAKAHVIINHFRSIPDRESAADGSEAVVMSAVSGSLLGLLESRVGGVTHANQEQQQQQQVEPSPSPSGSSSTSSSFWELSDDEEEEGGTTVEVGLQTEDTVLASTEAGTTSSEVQTALSEIAGLGEKLQAILSAGFEGLRSHQGGAMDGAMGLRLDQMERDVGDGLEQLVTHIEALHAVTTNAAPGLISLAKTEKDGVEEAEVEMPPSVDAMGFQLSEEERAQEEDEVLFVRSTDMLEASSDVEGDMEVLTELSRRVVLRDGDVTSVELCRGVDVGREVIAHSNPAAFNDDDRLPVVVSLCLEAMKRGQATCALNGLALMGDLFGYAGKMIHEDDVEELVETALRHAMSDQDFMVLAAKMALDAAFREGDKHALLYAVLPHCCNSGAGMAREAIVYLARYFNDAFIEEVERGGFRLTRVEEATRDETIEDDILANLDNVLDEVDEIRTAVAGVHGEGAGTSDPAGV